ncbi:MAG: acyltransferase [Alistipes senegalensis]|nr:acyltransferase [Oxalobacter formigenes]MCM1281595.1 acyltransferase [Alistipes senegalensis]
MTFCAEKQKQDLAQASEQAPSAKEHIAYRPDIDGLRAVAVLLVIGFHAFPKYIRGGFIGVDIFFVISGFLITSLILKDLEKHSFSFTDFYTRRIRRIFPALSIVLSASLIFGWFGLLPDEYRQLGKHTAGGAGFISNLILWKESGYFDVASELKPLLHLWSLGIEEQYYILFPLFLYGLWKKKLNLLTGTTLLMLISFGINLALYKKNPVADFYFPGSRFWELLAGATLAYLTLYPSKAKWITPLREKRDKLLYSLIYTDKDKTRQQNLSGNLLSILGILLIAFIAYKLTKGHPFPGKWAILPVLGAVFLIAAGPEAAINRKILSFKPLVWIGLISYPLYLWHWPLLSFARMIQGKTPSSLVRAGLVLLAFILAGLTYILVERPIRFGRYRKAKAIGIGVAVAILGLAGLYVKNHKGLPNRANMVAYEKRAEQLIVPPARDEAGVEYVCKEKTPRLICCRYSGTDFEKTVAVVGDSHAQSAYPGIAKLGKQMGFNTILLGSTFPGMDTWMDPAGWDPLPEIMDILLERQDIQRVFLVFRVRLRISGEHNFVANRDKTLVKEKIVPAGLFKARLQSIVDRLKTAGKEVIIVGDNPELFAHPGDYVERPFSSRSMSDFPVLLKKDVLAYQKEALALLGEIKGAEVISPIDVFCPLDKCRVFDEEGLPFYYDDDHLSVAGSELQARGAFLPYLRRMVEKGKNTVGSR